MKAETEIRRACKNAWIQQKTKTALNKDIRNIIAKALRSVRMRELVLVAEYSLWRFYERQWRKYEHLQGVKTLIWLYLLTLEHKGKQSKKTGISKARAKSGLKTAGYDVRGSDPPLINGVPLNTYAERYFEEHIKPTFERLLNDEPKDPHDVSGRNSLRNRAEMEVRYHGHLEQIEDLKRSGHRLVIASSHSDCSERCRPWQARVYSLDGTSGKTDDGRLYVPLEQATDIYYTTKAGITYKNGLLGFNCRHYLVPYQKGLVFPVWSKAIGDREYRITEKQRYLERGIRKWKYRAEMMMGQSETEYKRAKKKAKWWELRYKEFCRENSRAIENTRTTIL